MCCAFEEEDVPFLVNILNSLETGNQIIVEKTHERTREILNKLEEKGLLKMVKQYFPDNYLTEKDTFILQDNKKIDCLKEIISHVKDSELFD